MQVNNPRDEVIVSDIADGVVEDVLKNSCINVDSGDTPTVDGYEASVSGPAGASCTPTQDIGKDLPM